MGSRRALLPVLGLLATLVRSGVEEEALAVASEVTPRPGILIGGKYRLVSRVRSLPSTFGPTAAALPGQESGPDAFGLTTADSWLTPQLLLPDIINETTSSGALLALAEPGAANADAGSARPLALPSPFESEMAVAASSTYRLHRRVHGKSDGEIWRAVRADDPSGRPLVMKRLTLGTQVSAAGLRERYFGESLRGLDRIARFVDAFELGNSLWLVRCSTISHSSPITEPTGGRPA